MDIDDEACYRAVKSKDQRFDGWFFVGVTSTGIFCRPSCPATTPQRRERALLPHRGGRPGRRLPGLPALPARHRARQPRVERARRPRLAGHAADRRRPPRPGGRGRRRPPHGGQRAPPPPRARARSWAPLPWRWPGPAGPRRPGSSSRPPSCRSPTSPSPPGSPASASSTTRSASSSAPAPPCCAPTAPRRSSGAGPAPVSADAGARPHPDRPAPRHPRPLRRPRGRRVPRPAGHPRRRGGRPRRHVPPGPAPARAVRRSCRCAPRPTTSRPASSSSDLRDLGPAVARCRRLLDLDADPEAVDEALSDRPGPAAPRGRVPRAGAPRAPPTAPSCSCGP